MQIESIEKLVSSMLDMQIETGDKTDLTSFTADPNEPLSTDAITRLIKSPIARYQFIDALNAEHGLATEKLVNQGVELQLVPLAASESDNTVNEFQCSGFSVVMYDNRDKGCPIIILLQLNKVVLDVFIPLSIVRLYDSGGLEWLRGKPNQNGEVSAEWLDVRVDLFSRVKRYNLQIELV